MYVYTRISNNYRGRRYELENMWRKAHEELEVGGRGRNEANIYRKLVRT